MIANNGKYYSCLPLKQRSKHTPTLDAGVCLDYHYQFLKLRVAFFPASGIFSRYHASRLTWLLSSNSAELTWRSSLASSFLSVRRRVASWLTIPVTRVSSDFTMVKLYITSPFLVFFVDGINSNSFSLPRPLRRWTLVRLISAIMN